MKVGAEGVCRMVGSTVSGALARYTPAEPSVPASSDPNTWTGCFAKNSNPL